MPTTQPLDDEYLGDIAGGQLKSIAGYGTSVESAPQKAAPQQKAAAQPGASAPAPATPRTEPKKPEEERRSRQNVAMRPTGIGDPGLRLTKTPRQQTDDAKPTGDRQKTQSESRDYTHQQLLDAWHEFIDTNRAEHLLTNAMKSVQLSPAADNVYEIAQSRIHLAYISENLARVTSFIRAKLHNDNISFAMREVSEDSPLAWNSRELLNHMVESNKGLSDFIKGLDLTLM